MTKPFQINDQTKFIISWSLIICIDYQETVPFFSVYQIRRVCSSINELNIESTEYFILICQINSRKLQIKCANLISTVCIQVTIIRSYSYNNNIAMHGAYLVTWAIINSWVICSTANTLRSSTIAMKFFISWSLIDGDPTSSLSYCLEDICVWCNESLLLLTPRASAKMN